MAATASKQKEIRSSRLSSSHSVALAIRRDDHGHAWMLLQAAASPRSPFTIVLAEWLAEKLGHGDELRHMHRERQVPLAELDATPMLAAELDAMKLTR